MAVRNLVECDQRNRRNPQSLIVKAKYFHFSYLTLSFQQPCKANNVEINLLTKETKFHSRGKAGHKVDDKSNSSVPLYMVRLC